MLLRSIFGSAAAAVTLAATFALPATVLAQSAAPQPGATAAPQQVTKAQLTAQLDSNFAKLDSNKDKSLNKAEIEAAQTRNLAEAKAELDKRVSAEFTKLDADKNGTLTLAEFKAFVPGPRVQPSDELLKQLDRNNDGKVGQDEFRATPLANFDRIDLNKDGTISADERTAAQRRQ